MATKTIIVIEITAAAIVPLAIALLPAFPSAAAGVGKEELYVVEVDMIMSQVTPVKPGLQVHVISDVHLCKDS